jgi:coenzyme F420-0:L-glutamate ligase/coenzyme F420-1:gamma-L-glutamate ligase
LKNKDAKPLVLIPIVGIPDIHPGDALNMIIERAILDQGDELIQGDIVVITQKIVSKSEDRYVHSTSIIPSDAAKIISAASQKPPELIELILQESRAVLRYNDRAVIVEHKLGFVCANAGIDRSNVMREEIGEGDWYLLLPKNPDKSAAKIREYLEKKFTTKIGVMIIDSHGRAWRYGTVGTAIGVSGAPALVDLRGTPDLYGRELKITRVGVADELAGAASLVMGQAAEKIPAVIARGFPYALREASIQEILRSEDKDMFK